jgi:enamine deaminase RidA (YjgF/YER057c/UK114 family)
MTLTHLNPEGVEDSQYFSQAVLIDGGSFAVVVVGGQNGTDESGEIVADSLEEQTVQAFRNLLAVLTAVDADQRHVAKLTIYIQSGHDIPAGYEAASTIWGDYPTAITVLQVAGFARPDALVEVEALAVVPRAA